MEINKILQADYLDLVFDNRNKDYGSYELRKHYNRRVLTALSLMVSAIALAVAIPFAIGKIFPEKLVMDLVNHVPKASVMTDIIYDIKPEKIIPKKIQPPNASIAKTVAVLPPKIVRDNDVKPTEAPAKITDDAKIGAVTNPGNNGTNVAASDKVPTGPAIAGKLNGDPKPMTEVVNNNPVNAPDVMPEYPGGMAALQKYLQSTLKYPSEARENAVQGRVIVKFVVNELGKIENAQVIRGIGAGCDKEALRVVNAMKNWKPGMVNGRAVKVYYTLPITFKLGDN